MEDLRPAIGEPIPGILVVSISGIFGRGHDIRGIGGEPQAWTHWPALGDTSFVGKLECCLGRPLKPQKPGRKPKQESN